MLSRRQTLAGCAGFMAALATGSGKTALASRVERRVPYGSCVNIAPLQDEAEFRAALESYCQQVIPEYGLYWDYLRPTRDQFNFDYGDKVLAFAEANEMLMRGHTLVWYAAMPEWTKQISSAAEAERGRKFCGAAPGAFYAGARPARTRRAAARGRAARPHPGQISNR